MMNLLEDLKGGTVGAVTSSSAEKIALGHKSLLKDFSIEGEVSLSTVLRKLSGGRYGPKGLALSNEDVTSTIIKKEKFDNLEAVYTAETNGFGVAFSKKLSIKNLLINLIKLLIK